MRNVHVKRRVYGNMVPLLTLLLSLVLLSGGAFCQSRQDTYGSTAPELQDQTTTATATATETTSKTWTPTKYYEFNVGYTYVHRLNTTKRLIAVNGQFPGPSIYVYDGDRVSVKVINNCSEEVALHWHGVRQFLTAWADGTAYITQCPLQPGNSYYHNFTVSGQTGTLLWHAHITWLRATLHGAFVIAPQASIAYPFEPQPDYTIPIVLGEWWNMDTLNIEQLALKTGGAPNVSNAATINGFPGPLYNQSANEVYTLKVLPGKTYRLGVINAGLEVNFYFGVANHSLTVVEVDASYVKPFTTDLIFLSPGQTADVLLTTNWTSGRFYMGATIFSIVPNLTYPNTTTTAIIEYPTFDISKMPNLPTLPAHNDTATRQTFLDKLRSVNNTLQTTSVPQSVDRDMLFTVGYAFEPNNTCPPLKLCQGTNNSRFSAAVNNISFDNPWNTSLLKAFFVPGQINNIFTAFPEKPLYYYNFTGVVPSNTTPMHGTKVTTLNFNENVQLVLQDTAILAYDVHPFHLHGHTFYVVGTGTGNYDASVHPSAFNLVDPPQRNTVGVPAGGWVALRWTASNPGAWLFHCHLEMHLSWGMEMVFVVKDGVGTDQTLPPPPPDYPPCKKLKKAPH